MDGVDLHPGSTSRLRRIPTRQIHGAYRVRLVRGQAIDKRDEAATHIRLVRRGGYGISIQRMGSPRPGSIADRVTDNAIEPGIDAIGVLELLQMPGGPQQGILEDVIHGVLIGYPTADEGSETVQIGRQDVYG